MSASPQKFGSPNRVSLNLEVSLNHVRRDHRDHYSYGVHFRTSPKVQKLEEKIRTKLPEGISFADLQRSLYEHGLNAFAEYLRSTGVRITCNSFANLQAMVEEDNEWESFLASLPELRTRVMQDMAKRNFERAKDRIDNAIQTVREYGGDSILAIKTLQGIYTWIPDQLRGQFPKIPVLWGLEDFAPADPDSEPEQ